MVGCLLFFPAASAERHRSAPHSRAIAVVVSLAAVSTISARAKPSPCIRERPSAASHTTLPPPTGIGFNTPIPTFPMGGGRGSPIEYPPVHDNAKTLSRLRYYTVIYVTTERGSESLGFRGVIFRSHGSSTLVKGDYGMQIDVLTMETLRR